MHAIPLPLGFIQGLTALQALTDLTKLAFSEVLLDDEALSILASLMQLQDLGLMTAINRQEGVTLAGVMQLTELTALTSLELNRYAAGPHSDVAFVNEVSQWPVFLHDNSLYSPKLHAKLDMLHLPQLCSHPLVSL